MEGLHEELAWRTLGRAVELPCFGAVLGGMHAALLSIVLGAIGAPSWTIECVFYMGVVQSMLVLLLGMATFKCATAANAENDVKRLERPTFVFNVFARAVKAGYDPPAFPLDGTAATALIGVVGAGAAVGGVAAAAVPPLPEAQ